MPTTKCKIGFSKVLQSLCTAKSKNKSDIFIYTFSRNLCFNSSFKNNFQEAFFVKNHQLKNTPHALNPLVPGGNKRSHILKTSLLLLAAGLFKYDLFWHRALKG